MTTMTIRGPVSPVLWWTRDFSGGTNQVSEARHWIKGLLPECDVLTDVLLAASELCANAVVHTLSGATGGWFSVDVEWTPALVRVVVGDQGSALAPALSTKAGDAIAADDSGRGLWLVAELADDWGTACHPAGRVVWADVRWQARGGPPSTGERSGEEDDVIAMQCSCGFTELDDEEIGDHLQRVFEPADLMGNDGQVHEERNPLTCACGLAAITAEELDAHILQAFTPDDAIGGDGKRHEAPGYARSLADARRAAIRAGMTWWRSPTTA